MKVIITFLMLVLTSTSQAGVDQVTFDVAKIQNKRDFYFPNYSVLEGKDVVTNQDTTEHWSHMVNLGVDYTLFRSHDVAGYWNQNIAGYATTDQYRKVVWDWEFGINIWKQADVFWHHKSEHGLEHKSFDRYPIEDMYGVRFYLFKK